MTETKDPNKYEEENVHEVYQEIAGHFSATRFKAWPIVERFLQELPAGSVGLDVGCGNGKNMLVNKDVFIVGSDRSENLARIAMQHHPHSTVVADILSLPHKNSSFDFAISIAVVHHLSTPSRRIEAVAEMLRTLKPGSGPAAAGGAAGTDASSAGSAGGKLLVYAWALEQKTSRRGWDKGDPQDIMVPWVRKSKTSEEKTFNRYYHLYEEGELEKDIVCAGGVVLESGYEKDNWWAIASPQGPA